MFQAPTIASNYEVGPCFFGSKITQILCVIDRLDG